VKSHTVYRTFHTERRREFVRITEDVAAAVQESGVQEGMVLVSAMHITAGVWVNDDEPGIQEEFDGRRDKRLVIKVMGE
jgi:thiamine phosphate synthase YjbQ (UPF0047 family)